MVCLKIVDVAKYIYNERIADRQILALSTQHGNIFKKKRDRVVTVTAAVQQQDRTLFCKSHDFPENENDVNGTTGESLRNF